MGTFHHDKGELHGITVVVDTPTSQIFIGRCDTEQAEGITLLDADEHDEEGNETDKAAYVKRAKMVGIWKKHDRIFISREQIKSVTRLAQA